MVPTSYASTVKPKAKKKVAKKKVAAPIYDSVDQNEFEQYLRQKVANRQPVNIRYQSQKKNSANKWRLLYLSSYDTTYLLAASEGGFPYRYRRDRVVEYK